MMKPVLAISLLLMLVSPVLAQGGQQDTGCTRDVQRFCRAQINDGDMVVLACLQQNRARLSKTCAKVLTDNGR
jgi:hypothetical protein